MQKGVTMYLFLWIYQKDALSLSLRQRFRNMTAFTSRLPSAPRESRRYHGYLYRHVSCLYEGSRGKFAQRLDLFDKYHIMKVINVAVDEVRKNEPKQKNFLRGQKYVFLKHRNNLTESQLKALHSLEAMP